MMKCLLLSLTWLCLHFSSGSLHTKLHYFETLKIVDVRTRNRRSLDQQEDQTQEVSFFALGRPFNLMVKADASILAKDFKSFVVKEDGQVENFHVNKNDFFKGHSLDEESVVSAHKEDDQWCIHVATENDTYTLEPSWRHLPLSDNHSLIAYRHSDIKWDHTFPHLAQNGNSMRKKICEAVHPEDTEESDNLEGDVEELENEDNSTAGVGRKKRQAAFLKKNTCNLMVVADHLFFQNVGGGFKHRTSNYLIGMLQRISNLYRETMWDGGRIGKGFGFQIKEMRIHDKATPVPKGETHYNMKPVGKWDTRKLLEDFSGQVYFGKFCLAHLFTYQMFSGGVLGLAYIASPRLGTVGGICSKVHKKRGRSFFLNTGWSSSMNTAGLRQLTQESILITAHGHNWGSEHDVDTEECAPSSFNKGKFIMYPYAVSGWEENNHAFSPCSRRYVSDVILAKAYKCFTVKEDHAPYCGDSIVDKNEMCDAGPDGDECCSSTCRFKAGATCSPMNYECCENCQMASSEFFCRISSKFSCDESTKCNYDCPEAGSKSDGTECVDGGVCQGGRCQSFCEYRDREPCLCNEKQNACRRCCKPLGGEPKSCLPYGDAFLGEGRPCYQGYCTETGDCEKANTDLIFRFFDFIEKLTPSKFVEVMRSNIVGTVIVLSMIIWIPASWIFSCIDKRKEREDIEFRTWRNSRYLFSPDEIPQKSIKIAGVHRLHRPAPPRRALSQSTGSVSSMERESTV